MSDIQTKTKLTINQIRKLNSVVYFDFGSEPYTDYYFEQGDIDQFRESLSKDAFDFLMNHTMRSFK